MNTVRPPAALDHARALVLRDDIGLADIPAESWDALVPDQPLLAHAFLSALHVTECASPRTGWRPRFVTAWAGESLAGAMPLYAKTHSFGEYVFDWAWADAYRRYQPPLLSEAGRGDPVHANRRSAAARAQ